MRLAVILLAGGATLASVASVLAQDYGQPYPLNQSPQSSQYPSSQYPSSQYPQDNQYPQGNPYPQAPAYQQPYQQPYQPAPQPLAPQPIAPQAAPVQGDQLGSREAIALQNQLLELRRDLQNLQAQGPVRRGNAQPLPPSGTENDLVPQLLDRVSNLEDEVRRLRGEVEDQRNQLQRQQEDFSKQIGDLQFHLQNGGNPAAPGAPPAAEAPPPPSSERPAAPPPARPRRTPELTMQEGDAALARRDYGTAEAAAHEVLGAGRTGPRAGDAQLLLAQALAGKRDYQGAAVAYGDAYQRLKGGSRGQDALLGLASSLSSIGEKPATCGALDQLRAAYPSPRRDVRDTAASLRGRAGCH